jgi:hypothetical protein
VCVCVCVFCLFVCWVCVVFGLRILSAAGGRGLAQSVGPEDGGKSPDLGTLFSIRNRTVDDVQKKGSECIHIPSSQAFKSEQSAVRLSVVARLVGDTIRCC